MGIRPDDTQIAAIPLSHAYGLGNLLMPVLLQGTAIVLREGVRAAAARRRTRATYGARRVSRRAVHVRALRRAPPAGGVAARPATRSISAGAPLDAATVRALPRRFGVKIHSFYGTSETGGIAYDDCDELDDAATVGRPLPGVTRHADGPRTARRRTAAACTSRARRSPSGYAGERAADGAFVGRRLPDRRLRPVRRAAAISS